MNYWKANLLILSIILFIWFVVSFGFGIIWSESLDEIKIWGFKLGFGLLNKEVFTFLYC